MTLTQTLAVGALGAFFALTALFALAALAATAYTAACRALTAREDRQARQARRTEPEPTDAIDTALVGDCCDTWWATAGAHHNPTCPNQTREEQA